MGESCCRRTSPRAGGISTSSALHGMYDYTRTYLHPVEGREREREREQRERERGVRSWPSPLSPSRSEEKRRDLVGRLELQTRS